MRHIGAIWECFFVSKNYTSSRQNTLRLRKCCGNIRGCRKGLKGKEGLAECSKGRVYQAGAALRFHDVCPTRGPHAQKAPSAQGGALLFPSRISESFLHKQLIFSLNQVLPNRRIGSKRLRSCSTHMEKGFPFYETVVAI